MTNPTNDDILEKQPPSVENFVDRIKSFAKALAYGAAHDECKLKSDCHCVYHRTTLK